MKAKVKEKGNRVNLFKSLHNFIFKKMKAAQTPILMTRPDVVFSVDSSTYWTGLSVNQKNAYFRIAERIMEDKVNIDQHMGDPEFQSAVIGGVDSFINTCYESMSERYTKSETFGFPRDLREGINKSDSIYKFESLCAGLLEYLPKPGEPKDFKINERSWKKCLVWLGMLEDGRKKMDALPIIEQFVLLRECFISNSQAGHPHFITQNKENLLDLTIAFISRYCPKTWKRFKAELKPAKPFELWAKPKSEEGKTEEQEPKVVELLPGIVSYRCIKSMLIELDKMKFYPPYLLFCRTGMDEKHRCVFGAPFPVKLKSALQAAFKALGYASRVKEGVYSDGNYFYSPNKTLPASGPVPLFGQEDWDVMFNYFVTWLKSNTDENGDLVDKTMDVIGSDVSGWDKSVRYRHISWILKFKPLRWFFAYTLNTCQFSEVWVGPKRVLGVFWKSGHELTSDGGSVIHDALEENAIDDANKEKKDKGEVQNAELVGATFLADDSFEIVRNVTADQIAKYFATQGFKVKVNESFSYNRDHILGFLKVLVGDVLKSGELAFIGDPQSRYHKLAHSERELEIEIVNGLMRLKRGDTSQMWLITKNPILNQFLSKLSSTGHYGSDQVMRILEITKDTGLGQEGIAAISALSQTAKYESYRTDLTVGFRPNWLANLPVSTIQFHRRTLI